MTSLSTVTWMVELSQMFRSVALCGSLVSLWAGGIEGGPGFAFVHRHVNHGVS